MNTNLSDRKSSPIRSRVLLLLLMSIAANSFSQLRIQSPSLSIGSGPLISGDFSNYIVYDSYLGSSRSASLYVPLLEKSIFTSPFTIAAGIRLSDDAYGKGAGSRVAMPVDIEIGLSTQATPIYFNWGVSYIFGDRVNVEPFATLGFYYVKISSISHATVFGEPPFVDFSGNDIYDGDRLSLSNMGLSFRFGINVIYNLTDRLGPFIKVAYHGTGVGKTSVFNDTTGNEVDAVWTTTAGSSAPELVIDGVLVRAGLRFNIL